MDPRERATLDFNAGFNCSQSVLLAFAEELGLSKELARIATGFGGGMGRTGSTCGVVTGAIMVIGLKYGQITAPEKEAKENTYGIVREFIERFKSMHGSLDCPSLLGVDMSHPGGREKASEMGLFKTRCPLLVGDATEIVSTLLSEQPR